MALWYRSVSSGWSAEELGSGDSRLRQMEQVPFQQELALQPAEPLNGGQAAAQSLTRGRSSARKAWATGECEPPPAGSRPTTRTRASRNRFTALYPGRAAVERFGQH
jgi:hypothetical protein